MRSTVAFYSRLNSLNTFLGWFRSPFFFRQKKSPSSSPVTRMADVDVYLRRLFIRNRSATDRSCDRFFFVCFFSCPRVNRPVTRLTTFVVGVDRWDDGSVFTAFLRKRCILGMTYVEGTQGKGRPIKASEPDYIFEFSRNSMIFAL